MMPGASRFPHVPFAFFLFVFAFTVRIVFALQWQDMPYGTSPLLDAQVYDDWAQALANGGHPSPHAFYQSPLYPYFLSFLYRITGHSYLAVSFLNAALDSVTVVVVAFVSFSLFGRRAGFVTAALAAFYEPMIFYAAPPMKESLVLFLLALFLWMALRVIDQNKYRDYGICGFIFGLAVLARGNLLLLFPIVPILSCLHYRNAAFKPIAIFTFFCMLAITPAAWHNYKTSHDFVPIAYADGFNLYIGHFENANGANAYPVEVSTGPQQERLDTTWVAEQAEGRTLLPSEVSSFWRHKAESYAFHHPLREIELLGLKLFAFWNGADSFDNYDQHFIKANFPSLLNFPLVVFWLISPLAIFTLVASAPTLRNIRGRKIVLLGLCLVTYMVSVVIFYITDRYRLPVVVFLLPLAGGAFSCAQDLIKREDKKHLVLAGSVSLLFLIIGLCKPIYAQDLTAFDWGVLTQIYAAKGENENALDAFNKGLALSLEGMGAQGYVNAAKVYEEWGQLSKAQELVSNAAKIFPKDGFAYYSLGRIQALRGDLDDALASMHQAETLDPTYSLTYFALARLYERKGMTSDAQAAVQKGLEVDPENALLLSFKVQKPAM